MRWLRFAVLLLVASVLQTSLVGAFGIRGAKPDLLLILLVFFATRSSSKEAILASFVIGFVADLISATTGLMGPRIISFGLFGTLLADVSNVLALRKLAHQAAVIFLAGGLTAGLSHLLIFLRAETAPASLTVELLWQPLYSALLGPFLFVPAAWWMRMYGKGRRDYAGRRRRR